MQFSLDDVQFLKSTAGQQLLARLAEEDLSDLLKLIPQLRQSFSQSQTSAAVEVAQVRLKAHGKFGSDAARLLLTRDALEQASDPQIRAYRASKFSIDQLVDVCCGIGTDSFAFARAGAQVLGVDFDPVRIAMARYNAEALGVAPSFDVADARQLVLGDAPAFFFDPARRDEQGRRIYDVEQYIPPLSVVRRWQGVPGAVKLSPGVDVDQLVAYAGTLEFISVAGDLKEAVLWLNRETKTVATLITEQGIFSMQRTASEPEVAIAAPRTWLCEPDPSILRAGLVRDLAAELNGVLLDKTIAYFTTEQRPDSVWVRAWRVLDWMPFHLKRLRAYLRERHVGRVTVKKRGSPLTPESLIQKLKLKGDAELILALTRFRGDPIVVVCETEQANSPDVC